MKKICNYSIPLSIREFHSSIIYYFRSVYVLSSILFVASVQPTLHGIYIPALIFIWSLRFVKRNKHININMSNLKIISIYA